MLVTVIYASTSHKRKKRKIGVEIYPRILDDEKWFVLFIYIDIFLLCDVAVFKKNICILFIYLFPHPQTKVLLVSLYDRQSADEFPSNMAAVILKVELEKGKIKNKGVEVGAGGNVIIKENKRGRKKGKKGKNEKIKKKKKREKKRKKKEKKKRKSDRNKKS
ncbi:hypothetical protein RFI_37333 [Reticulomyxa filosa]|uniref:Uncharacterized protein n=1 Tax=Reticulomyxa filosa TaxID=46433 RepID=X6LG60_RETFI|nr:hypothetical protein RFI_37333 [Reticulomyxa filosa]|eukprot:ETO00127.1 hypothetical protein RFI_37333 [Reticulomyxa filosa]